MIVGQTMGADALAAVGATSTVVCLILYFIQGLTSGFGIKLDSSSEPKIKNAK